MKIRRSIGFKIFFLAASLVLAIFIVALSSYFRTAAVNNESKEITEYYLPLTQFVSRVDESIMRQELHFSRIISNLKYDSLDLGFTQSKIQNLKDEALNVKNEIAFAINLVDEGLQRTDLNIVKAELEKVKPWALKILAHHQSLFQNNLKIIEELNKSNADSARSMIKLNVKMKEKYNSSINNLVSHLRSLTLRSSKQADQHEAYVLRFNFLITLFATAFGVILAFLITRSLVKPVHRLVKGSQRVETGNLDTEVAETSIDEIGELTKSFNKMVTGLRLKERVKETFGKYIDPRIVEQLIDQPDGIKSEGEKRVMTVLFSDLKGFTSISEGLNPATLVKIINIYLSEMSQPVSKHQGVIDKYIGDAIMAYWGPPFSNQADHARLACLASIEKVSKLETVRSKLYSELGEEINNIEVNMRIGISTGEMIVGNIGSEFSKGYTVLGDMVNTASRLESVNKVYGTQILITESTKHMAGDTLETREIDRIQAMGKEEAINIFELLGMKGAVSTTSLELRDQYEKGLQAYRLMDWDVAQKLFESCLDLNSQDGPTKIFLERIENLKYNPPPGNWAGVWKMTNK